jgi:hypothetical protein
MNWVNVFGNACGYEQIGDQVRVYVESADPKPSFNRHQGVRSALFHLYAGSDAEAILAWLARNRAWQSLRVAPEYCPEWGAKAVLLAFDWNSGEATGMFRFATTRTINDVNHRRQLQREVRWLISAVLENPVRDGEFEDLLFLEDVINSAPVGAELTTPAQIVDAFFGAGR